MYSFKSIPMCIFFFFFKLNDTNKNKNKVLLFVYQHHLVLYRAGVPLEHNASLISIVIGNTTDWIVDYSDIETKFSVRSAEEPEDDLCYLVPGRQETVSKCGFNTTAQTFAVIHGWSVSGPSMSLRCNLQFECLADMLLHGI